MQYFRLLLIALGVLASYQPFAQLTEFSSDPTKFPNEVEKHLASFDRQDAKVFAEKFEVMWMNVDASDKSRIIAMSNQMAAKKMRPYPEFKEYWEGAYELLGGKKANPAMYQTWQGILDKLIENKQKGRFQEFLSASSGLLARNVIFESNVVKWTARGGSFQFELVDNKGQIKFENIRLSCYANDDSSVVAGTSGTFDPSVYNFLGKGGKVFWTRGGKPEAETYADLSRFKINTKSATYKADSVTLHTPYFAEPVLGDYDEKVLNVPKGRDPEYPVFESYSQNLKIKQVVEGVDYVGGFTLKAKDFIGTGKPDKPARLIFHNGDLSKPFAIAKSLVFSIEAERIAALPASIVFYTGTDSITHPYLRFQYEIANDSMVLIRVKEALGQSAFTNSYQKMDMYFDALYWTMNDSVLYFGNQIGSKTDAQFQSINFIDREAYARLSSFGGVNPAEQVAAYATRYDEFEFDAPKLATGLTLAYEDAKPIFYQLANLGLISFDPVKNRIKTLDRLFLYTDGLKGKKDHDAIQFLSDTKNAPGDRYNAVFNLKTQDLKITGLQRVILSEPQYVRLYPDKTTSVIVHKNRDMTFGGILVAGSTEYFGTRFAFDYEKFKVELVECDSMRLRVWPFTEQQGQVRVTSVIESVKGTVLVDSPDNKAGVIRKYHDFPKLTVTKESYVYYDKPSIHRGIYNRKDFLFVIAPFAMDSLDDFDRDFMAFDGVFKSAGIFPDMNEKLRVQEDYSLGFVRKAPEAGLSIYKDKSLFKNEIRLSAKGLQGDGKIEFLTSTATSKAFTFFPDSTAGIAQSYDNVEALKPKDVPLVKGEEVYVRYAPKEKVLVAKSLKTPIKFFGDQAALKGSVFLTPEGMTGRGKMSFANATLNARKFSYTSQKIKSDTAAFDLLNTDLSEMAFKTGQVSADVDFKERVGKFKSNTANEPIQFLENQYIAYMDEFKWYMDVDDIELVKKSSLTIESSEFEKPNFYSVHPKQDSLSFMAPFARFNVNSKEIRCTKVPYMDIADARIVPDSGKVTIQKKAKMETLLNAQILANNVTKNHLIKNATVEVTARRAYEASGDYFYKDETDKEFKIHFAKIKPDTAYQTFAQGAIQQEEAFRLSPNFEFYGAVELAANNQFLVFDGATRIAHNCSAIPRNWMNFRAEINPLEIYIPVSEEMKDLEGEPIGAGIVWSIDSVAMYTTFLSKKGSASDVNVMTAAGFLYYDKGAKEYRISNKEKLKELSLPGNYVSMHADLCLVSGDGRINIDEGLGQVDLNTVGSLSYNMANNDLSMRVAMGLNFPFLENAIQKMAAKMKVAEGIEPLDITRTFYKKAVAEIVSPAEADRLESDITLKGEMKGKIPDQLVNPLFFGDLRLKWDAESEAFLNDGKIGITNVYKEQVFKYYKGYVMVRPQRGSGKEKVRNTLSIYIEVDERNWYFFEYSLGVLEVISSDEDFNKVIAESKEENLKFKGEKGVSDLLIKLSADKGKVSKLKRNFEE